MGNFEKLSVLVIVVIIVMILVVALYTWTEDPNAGSSAATAEKTEQAAAPSAPASGTKTGTKVEFPDVAPKFIPGGGMAGSGTPLAGGAPAKDGAKDKPVSPFDPFFDRPLGGTPAISGDGSILPPVPGVDPASAKPAEPRIHVVAQGETIAKIAKIEYPSVGQRAIDAILKANPSIDPNRLRIGEKVVLPELAQASPAGAPGTPGLAIVKPAVAVAELRPGTVYVVRQGDTLPGISKRAYSSPGRWQDIWIENFGAIEDPDHLHAGTRLKLPK